MTPRGLSHKRMSRIGTPRRVDGNSPSPMAVNADLLTCCKEAIEIYRAIALGHNAERFSSASCKEAIEIYGAIDRALRNRFIRLDTIWPVKFLGAAERAIAAIKAAEDRK